MTDKQPIIIDSFRYDESNNYPMLIEGASGVLKQIFEFLHEWYDDSGEIEVHTSGSTGVPKTIRLTKAMMIASAKATCKHFSITGRSTLHLCLPVDFIAGKMMLVRAMVSGARLLIEEPGSSPLQGNREKITFAAMTPMQVVGVFASDPARFDLVDQLIIGGGPVSTAISSMLQTLTTRCYSTYGMTETATHVAVKVLNGPSKSDLFCAVGQTGFTIDERSCLVITASHLGITNMVTNDVVELADNQAFRWLGRFDNVVNTGGIKVFPERIEEKLARNIDGNYFIASQPDDVLGQKVILLVEGSSREINFSSLEKYEEPKQIYFVNQFNYTPTGKIQRELTLRKTLDA